ncbi:hypothetical protein GCM10010211_24080 [Streptomyces albospinus]|uniref:Uncharacterized protein n=1 Tax=Streptomyces albospinus TaxID=285515 RepID=A0ABQ2UX30_9ACTN|nr:hypothetical protein GCM10010211_24080 [Streptomyces albospinus]
MIRTYLRVSVNYRAASAELTALTTHFRDSPLMGALVLSPWRWRIRRCRGAARELLNEDDNFV